MLRLVTFLYLATALFDFPTLEGAHLHERILGGVEVDIKDHPYQLSFQLAGRHECGAVIISELWALTAAQCVIGSVSSMTLRAGSSDRLTGGVVHQVDHKIVHLNYSSETNDFDLALLRVLSPFVYGEGINSIALPEQGKPVGVGKRCTVTGWGNTSPGGTEATVLHMVEVPVVGPELCQEAFGAVKITERMICAGIQNGGAGSCQGDTGGAMVVNGELVGIVSWGLGCALPDHPDVYARVSAMRNWILENTGI